MVVDWLVGLLDGRMNGCLAVCLSVCLAGWLAGWLAGCLAVWLIGTSLVGWFRYLHCACKIYIYLIKPIQPVSPTLVLVRQ